MSEPNSDILVGDDDLTIGEPQEYPPMKINESKPKKKKALFIFIPIVIVAITIGIIGITYASSMDPEINDEFSISIDELEDSDVLTLHVTEFPPYALDNREIDFLKGKMNHQEPSVTQFQDMLFWAFQTPDNVLLEVRNEVFAGALNNSNYVSVGEKVLLEIITFTVYPELCTQNMAPQQCAFYDINLQQARYEAGDIDRDQYWLNVRQYASEEVIAEVEGNSGG